MTDRKLRAVQGPLLASVTPLPFHRNTEILSLMETLSAVGVNATPAQAAALVDGGMRGLGWPPSAEHKAWVIETALAAGWQDPTAADNGQENTL